jgi:hypothetical protein
MQDLQFPFFLEMNLQSNSGCQYEECEGEQQCEKQQAVIQACFLSLSHSHNASSIKILCQPKDNHIIPSLPLSGASMKTQGCTVIRSSTTLIQSCPVNCISCNTPFLMQWRQYWQSQLWKTLWYSKSRSNWILQTFILDKASICTSSCTFSVFNNGFLLCLFIKLWIWVFWDVMLCCHVSVDRYLEGMQRHHSSTLEDERCHISAEPGKHYQQHSWIVHNMSV